MIVSCKDRGYSAIRDDLPTVNVTTLDFTRNKLSALTDYMFDSFSDLRKLVLMQNPIKSYTARAFAGLKRLVYLDLSMTLLTSINTSLCRDMSALSSLVIVYGNSLNSISDDAFQGCNELHGVAIIGTLTLQTINKVFANLPELARLYLEDNENLQLTDPHAFDNSPQLVFLSLKGMGEQLSQLPKAVTSIRHCKHLTSATPDSRRSPQQTRPSLTSYKCLKRAATRTRAPATRHTPSRGSNTRTPSPTRLTTSAASAQTSLTRAW